MCALFEIALQRVQSIDPDGTSIPVMSLEAPSPLIIAAQDTAVCLKLRANFVI